MCYLDTFYIKIYIGIAIQSFLFYVLILADIFILTSYYKLHIG